MRRVWTIPARVREFTGRAGLLAELEAALRSGGPTVVQAVTGMGGIGKTTAAIEYAHRHYDEFDIAWWVPAEDPVLIPERLADLALALELTAVTDPAGVGVARLLGELAGRGRWLVVFDNAEDPRALSQFLPEGPGQVLITSRNPAWRGIAAMVGVREFTRAESITLLRRLAAELTDDEADRVADAVGDLPLAVEQAGSLLADTGLAVDKYLLLLGERAQDVLDHDPGGVYPQSVAASWAVAFDRLAVDDPTALDLLTVVAWCGAEPVWLGLFAEHPDLLPERLRPLATDPLVVARCTAILHRRGMATVSPHGLQVHRVPAALLRARSQASEVPGRPGGRRRWSGCSRRPRPATFDTIRARGRCGNGCCRMCWSRPTAMPPWTRFRPRPPGSSIAPRPICSSGVRSRPRWRRSNAPTRCGATNSVTITPTPSPRPATWR